MTSGHEKNKIYYASEIFETEINGGKLGMENEDSNVEIRMAVLRKLYTFHKKFMEIAMNLFEGEGLSRTEVMILLMLQRREYKTTDLAREVGIPTSTLTGIIDRLLKKGYVLRNRSEQDRRAVIISIGEKALEKTGTLSGRMERLLDAMENELPEKWWSDIYAELCRLEKELDKAGDKFK